MKNQTGSIILVAAILASLSMSGCGTSYVKQGEVGLLVNNMTGQIDQVLEPGYRLSIPINQHIIEYPVRQQQYVMVASAGEGQTAGDDSVKVNSLEGQTFSVDASIDYRIKGKDEVKALYHKYGMEFEDIVEKYYRSEFRTAINNAFSALSMNEAATRDGKLKVEAQALKDLQETLGKDGIEVTQVMIRAVHVPDAISQSIAAKTKAENELVQSRTVAQQKVVEAQAEAAAAVASAEGRAKARMIEATAEAKANHLVSGSLTANIVRMEYVKRLSDKIQIVLPEKSFMNFGGIVPPAADAAAK